MDARQARGMQLVSSGKVVEGANTWHVASQRNIGGRGYRVNPWAGSCTCPDHQALNIRCKHVWAVLITMETETTPEGTTVTETARMTYSQEWSSYNRAQTEEKDTFMRLLSDLCSTIPQPPQGRGRPRLPMADMAFASAFKVYSRFSSRRFSSDLRAAHERGLISRVPHFNSVSNYLSSPEMTPVLHDLITESSLPLRALESDFAVDSSGFTTSRFVRWFDQKHGAMVQEKRREWIKAHLMVGVRTNVVTSVEISGWRDADSRYFPTLVQDTAENFDVAEVSADKAYLSKKNLALAESVGATPYIPFKSNSRMMLEGVQDTPWARMYHRFAYEREAFLANYHKRSNVETTFAMVKGKFGDAVLSKSPVGMANEVLAKVLCHNIVVVGQAIHEFGIEPPAFCAPVPPAQELSA
jgi:transposase